MIQPSQFPLNKRAVLRCDGALEEGFRVALEISDRRLGVISEAVGELPASPELLAALAAWRQAYRQSLNYANARISLESVTVETGSLSQLEHCRQLSKRLESCLSQWLAYPGFQAIDQRLRESLNVQDEVEILLRTRDLRLHQLPWHRWGFIERYPKAELVLSTPSERIETTQPTHLQVRILAILGDRRGIDTDTDRQILEKTPNAEVMFLVEPSRQFLYRYLWEQSWDILFFAGHSYTSDQQGILNINQNERLSLEDLKYGLKKAIARGLKLAIFNSCDGLGLAHELEQLHIPQFIVMREPVPDRVAQEFLKRFLQTFAAGESLPTSVRQAKEWLQSLENDFPCASWLPILFHNSAMESLNWRQITQPAPAPPVELPEVLPVPGLKPAPRRRLRRRGIVATSLLVGGLVLGLRSIGGLQRSELWAYDQITRLQWQTAKTTPPDPLKIRLIGITSADTKKYGEGMRQENIISDRALTELIKKINRYQPKVIGLDVFRDTPQPNAAGYQQLLATLQTVPNLVVACQTGENDQAGQQAIPSIAAPKLPPTKAIGYADSLLTDPDAVTRRYVVQMEARPGAACITEQSFAWQIVQQIVPARKLQASVPADFGGYQDDPSQFGDDQLLVNYHPSSRNIRPYSLQDILYLNTDSELKQLFQDSVVLIGYNLGGNEDTHTTPIGRQNGVMIHTHVIRQLLGQTPSLRSLPQWAESGGILLGAILGGGLIWFGRSWRNRLALTLLLLLGMTLLAYLAMLQAVWLALLPIALASVLTIVTVTVIERQVQHRPTV